MQWYKDLNSRIDQWTKPQKTLALGLFLLGILGLAAVFSNKGFMNVSDFTEELGYLREHNERLALENTRLRKQIDALKSDPYVIEMLARDKLNLVKPGERVYQIVREHKMPSP